MHALDKYRNVVNCSGSLEFR